MASAHVVCRGWAKGRLYPGSGECAQFPSSVHPEYLATWFPGRYGGQEMEPFVEALIKPAPNVSHGEQFHPAQLNNGHRTTADIRPFVVICTN